MLKEPGEPFYAPNSVRTCVVTPLSRILVGCCTQSAINLRAVFDLIFGTSGYFQVASAKKLPISNPEVLVIAARRPPWSGRTGRHPGSSGQDTSKVILVVSTAAPDVFRLLETKGCDVRRHHNRSLLTWILSCWNSRGCLRPSDAALVVWQT